MLDTRINNLTYVNARERDNVSFHMNILGMLDEHFLMGVTIQDGGKRGRKLGFPHSLPPSEVRELLKMSPVPEYQAERIEEELSAGISRRKRDELTAFLSRHARLEIGFYHTDLEPELYEQLESGYDVDDDPCGCRFVVSIGSYASEWWMGWYRVKRVLVCTREKDQTFDLAWRYRDKEGWGCDTFDAGYF